MIKVCTIKLQYIFLLYTFSISYNFQRFKYFEIVILPIYLTIIPLFYLQFSFFKTSNNSLFLLLLHVLEDHEMK